MKNNSTILIGLCLFLLVSACLQKSIQAGNAESKRVLSMPEKGICAHRGAMDTHPENTLSAFREAVRLGAHMIEFDVRMTKDKALVILHDALVDRTSNGSGEIENLTLEEVRQLDFGSWKSARFKGEQIPTLKEALAVFPENVWLNIHLKGGAELGKKTTEVVLKEGRIKQSFLACGEEAAAAAKTVTTEIMICNMERQRDRAVYVSETIEKKSIFIQLLKRRGTQELEQEISVLKRNDIRVNYCCTDAPEEVKTLFESGVDFILVNELSIMLDVAAAAGVKPLQ